MKTFKTITDYEKTAKKNDYIVLGGRGLMDGIKSMNSKHDVYKVHHFKHDGSIVIKAYRGKTGFIVGAASYDQEVALLTKKEFNELPVLW